MTHLNSNDHIDCCPLIYTSCVDIILDTKRRPTSDLQYSLVSSVLIFTAEIHHATRIVIKHPQSLCIPFMWVSLEERLLPANYCFAEQMLNHYKLNLFKYMVKQYLPTHPHKSELLPGLIQGEHQLKKKINKNAWLGMFLEGYKI